MNFKVNYASLKTMSSSRRRQWLSFQIDRLWTRIVYARRLLSCGENSIVQKPLFWTPEYIELGRDILIWRGCRIEGVDQYDNRSYTPLISLGSRTSLQQNCHITAAGHLAIGDDCTLLKGVVVTDIDHEYKEVGRNVMAQPIIVQTTRIGRNCFIGAGAIIQAGTKLGDHCVVGANAVVRGIFPAYSVIGGVPARIIKRGNPETGEWLKTNTEGNFSK